MPSWAQYKLIFLSWQEPLRRDLLFCAARNFHVIPLKTSPKSAILHDIPISTLSLLSLTPIAPPGFEKHFSSTQRKDNAYFLQDLRKTVVIVALS